MRTGDLVKWRGSVGLVMGPVLKAGATGPDDVWVKWTDDPKPRWENARLLELVNASR